jgi:hypothetical protein
MQKSLMNRLEQQDEHFHQSMFKMQKEMEQLNTRLQSTEEENVMLSLYFSVKMKSGNTENS